MANSQNLKLSSDSMEIERENVLNHLGYANGIFAFSRTVDGSIPCRFYPTLEEAYRTTLEKFVELGLSKDSINNYFSISDNAGNIIYRGNVMTSGTIEFSVHYGIKTNITSTITEELNKLSTTNNLINNEMKENSTTTVAGVTYSTPETNEMIQALSRNAQVYLDNNIFTQSSLDFLCLPEDSAKSLAQLVHETAANNKDADNQTFTGAIADASNGMLTITKKLATGKPIADTHVSFHDDSLYCAVHCKSSEALFNGTNNWRKTPGKIAYGKIDAVIMDMYHKGQQLLLGVKDATLTTTTTKQAAAVEKLSISDVSANITSTIMMYLKSTPDSLHYLTLKGSSLESDLATFSNGVIAGNINNDNITLSVLSGQSCEISTNRYTTDEQLRNAITMNVANLFVGASISNITRDKVSSLVDLSTIEAFYINSTKPLFSTAA